MTPHGRGVPPSPGGVPPSRQGGTLAQGPCRLLGCAHLAQGVPCRVTPWTGVHLTCTVPTLGRGYRPGVSPGVHGGPCTPSPVYPVVLHQESTRCYHESVCQMVCVPAAHLLSAVARSGGVLAHTCQNSREFRTVTPLEWIYYSGFTRSVTHS